MSASSRSKSCDGDDGAPDLPEVVGCPACPSPTPKPAPRPEDPGPDAEGRSSLVRTFLAGALLLSFCACRARSPSDGESCAYPGKQKTKANAQLANRLSLGNIMSSARTHTDLASFHADLRDGGTLWPEGTVMRKELIRQGNPQLRTS